MRTLQIGNVDVVQARFNGHDLHKEFLRRGIESQHCVWNKLSNDPHTWQLANFRGRGKTRTLLERFEQRLSIQSLLYPFSYQLLLDKRFRGVDIAHYHLIHDRFFGITAMPFLSRMKPAVWTLHDPWAMTGHCIYPFDCVRWKEGCGNCPYLDTPFPMQQDRTALMWKIKRSIYTASDVDVILASKWMLEMAKQSPLLSRFRLHLIPYGIDLDAFKPADSEKAKSGLGIKPGSLALCFRAAGYKFKGLSYIKECLHKLHADVPICLVTLHEKGLLDEFKGRYQIIDLGWVNDENLLINAYNAADIFLMPSTAEAFGLMAVEAMACAKPVIVFDETSLPEVTFAPKGGIAVRQGDADGLRQALEALINNPEERLKLGQNARELACRHYDWNDHVDKTLNLYAEVIQRRNARADRSIKRRTAAHVE